MNRIVIVVAGALLGAAGLVHPASASIFVPFSSSSTLTIGGETFSGISCGGSACANLQWAPDPGATYGVQFQESTGAIVNDGGVTDLTLDFSVTGLLNFNMVGVAATGGNGGNSANNQYATVSETITTPTTATFHPPGNPIQINQAEVYTTLPSGYSTLDVKKDINISSNLPVGQSASVTNVRQDFQNKVPEPATISVMLLGLTALAAARRNRRR